MRTFIKNGSALLAVIATTTMFACSDQQTTGENIGSIEQSVSDADLTVVVDEGRTDLSCEGQPRVCFDVSTNGANITHIFVDVDAPCVEDARDYEIRVNDTLIEKLHDTGGPCNHGDREIVRDVWFPLIGNQAEAEVCLVFDDFVPDLVRVGAKAKDECEAATVNDECEDCEKGEGAPAARAAKSARTAPDSTSREVAAGARREPPRSPLATRSPPSSRQFRT
jgi:hypothetical protein